MTKYTAEQLESRFKKVGIIRKMNKEYARDDGYWNGGVCDWGTKHNLHQDCQTLANAFNKIDSLGNIKKELSDTTSKQEFNAKKDNFLRKVQEAEAGLKMLNQYYLNINHSLWENWWRMNERYVTCF